MDHIKYLGIYIDKFLSWDYHLQYLCTKLSCFNGNLSLLRFNTPIETLLQVYYSTYYSHLSYGCEVCGVTIQTLQVYYSTLYSHLSYGCEVWGVTIETLQVYYSTFYSHLSYGCEVWGVTSEKNIMKIKTLRKKSLRIMTLSDFHAHTHFLLILISSR